LYLLQQGTKAVINTLLSATALQMLNTDEIKVNNSNKSLVGGELHRQSLDTNIVIRTYIHQPDMSTNATL